MLLSAAGLLVDSGLTASLFDLGSALTDLEFWIAFTNDVNASSTLDDLAIGVAIFQCANAADNFHRSLSPGGALQRTLLIYGCPPEPLPGVLRSNFALWVAEYSDP